MKDGGEEDEVERERENVRCVVLERERRRVGEEITAVDNNVSRSRVGGREREKGTLLECEYVCVYL